MIQYLAAAFSIDANTWGLPKVFATDNTLAAIMGMVYMLVGAVSLFYIVRGALLFVQSNGDPNMIKQARTTILIALAAIVLATSVFTIINFFIANVGGNA